MFLFGLFGLRKKTEPAEKTLPQEKPLPEKKAEPLFICPLGWGLQKTDLYYDPAGKQYIVRYSHEGHSKLISQDEAFELLIKNDSFFTIVDLGKIVGFDPSDLLARSAVRREVSYKERNRLPAEGEIRRRKDAMGQLVEVYTNGTWVPDADRCEIAEGMHDHFTTFCIQQQNQSAQPKPPRNDRAWYDKALNRYSWTVPLQKDGPCFLTMFFDGDKKFLHYSFDVEAANDSHYILSLDGEARLRVMLTGPVPNYRQHIKTLNRLMTDFLQTGSPAALEAMVKEVCTEQHHY